MDTKKLVAGYGLKPRQEEHYLNDIGTQISAYRKGQGMTQEELGSKLGMGKDRISKIEKGGNPTIETISSIFTALNADLNISVEPQINYDSTTVSDLVLSIFEFSEKNSLTPRQAYRYLNRYGAIDFYIRNSEIEKSISMNETIDDFTAICKNNGGNL